MATPGGVSVPTIVKGFAESDSPNAVTLKLSEAEENLIRTLQKVVQAYQNGQIGKKIHESTSSEPINEAKKPKHALEFRIAGGWVRDRILGIESDDIDMAVAALTGVQAAQLVHEYLELQGLPTHKIGIIKANPDQSKHLETATMKVEGLSVDFCHLRSEEYNDSRIPIVSIGTPQQDALRRDFTMNALFFSLTSCQIEDWSGRGLQDLQNGVLVTPMAPMETFRDDPLRILRAVRFCVRYDFRLDEAIEMACADKEIQQALLQKVSRERVGKELYGMLYGKLAKPVMALLTLCRLGLLPMVVRLPQVGAESVSVIDTTGMPESGLWDICHRYVQQYRSFCVALSNTWKDNVTRYDDGLTSLGALLLPFRQCQYQLDSKQKHFPYVSYIMKDGLKLKKTDGDTVVNMHRALPGFMDLLTQQDLTRQTTGLAIYDAKECWVAALLLASILFAEREGNEKAMVCFSRVYNFVAEHDLDNCWKMKPHLNGKGIVSLLQMKPGPQVAAYCREQIVWMLAHPDGTEAQVQQHLLKFHDE